MRQDDLYTASSSEDYPERKGELYFLATETDQTIYFELLPLYAGEIKNFKLRFQVYTVPGQVKYNNTRKAVLQGADAIVFVADSQRSRREANQISFKNLQYNLKGGYNILLEDVPLVYEYNKRDMDDILTVEELNHDLNPENRTYFETIATKGDGVLEAFETISSLALKNLEARLLQLGGKSSSKQEQQAVGSPPAFFRKDNEISEESSMGSPEPNFSENNETDLFEDTELSFAEENEQILPENEPPEAEKAAEHGDTDRELSYVDIIAEKYQDGEIIFDEGEVGEEMYFIEEGKVRIVGSYKHTKKLVITYEKGDFFGEMALFGGRTRSARAVALGKTCLIPVTKKTLSAQIPNKPEIAIALLETLSNRIRNSTKTIGRLANQNKETMQHLKKARDMIKQLKEQNALLKQQLEQTQSS